MEKQVNYLKTNKLATVTAINSKHQAMVDRFLKADAKYNDIVIENDKIEGEMGAVPTRLANKQENMFDRAAELFHELPARERKNIAKNVDGIYY